MSYLSKLKEDILKSRNQIKRCPICNSSISDRKITLFKEMFLLLKKIYENRCFVFTAKDVKQWTTKNTYARLNDLPRITNLVSKSGDSYIINKENCEAFFSGREPTTFQVDWNQITDKPVAGTEKSCTATDVPGLEDLIDENLKYKKENFQSTEQNRLRQLLDKKNKGLFW